MFAATQLIQNKWLVSRCLPSCLLYAYTTYWEIVCKLLPRIFHGYVFLRNKHFEIISIVNWDLYMNTSEMMYKVIESENIKRQLYWSVWCALLEAFI